MDWLIDWLVVWLIDWLQRIYFSIRWSIDLKNMDIFSERSIHGGKKSVTGHGKDEPLRVLELHDDDEQQTTGHTNTDKVFGIADSQSVKHVQHGRAGLERVGGHAERDECGKDEKCDGANHTWESVCDGDVAARFPDFLGGLSYGFHAGKGGYEQCGPGNDLENKEQMGCIFTLSQ